MASVRTVDALVVGGGPPERSTLPATRAGRSVLLVDKATFPRDKCCGDGLTTLALRLGSNWDWTDPHRRLATSGGRSAPLAVGTVGPFSPPPRRRPLAAVVPAASTTPPSLGVAERRAPESPKATLSLGSTRRPGATVTVDGMGRFPGPPLWSPPMACGRLFAGPWPVHWR
ncbi:MAG: hypothetical protein Ct9H300mP12_02050 [Acidimicrobiales bacterium]|nr:MAG: hypothetical protein Ct9H300mP12_02050 [Acidimicrobiales bacterium]